MKKVFISMPMRGKGFNQVIKERDMQKEKLKGILGMPDRPDNEWEVIDGILDMSKIDIEIKNNPTIRNREVYCLANSLKYLSKADIAFFCKGWEQARGCKIEHEIAKQYGIAVVEE